MRAENCAFQIEGSMSPKVGKVRFDGKIEGNGDVEDDLNFWAAGSMIRRHSGRQAWRGGGAAGREIVNSVNLRMLQLYLPSPHWE